MNLIKGQPLDANNDLLELRNYARILKAARAKRIVDGRFRKLEEKILNLDNTNQYIEDDLSGLQLQGDPSGVKRRETRSLDGISDRTADRTTDIFLGDLSGNTTGDGLGARKFTKHKGCGVDINPNCSKSRA